MVLASEVSVKVLRLALILGVAALVYLAFRILIPRAVQAATARAGRELPEEMVQRAATLAHVLSNFTAVALMIVASFVLLSELGIDIAPLLAGVGIAGIAIGIGAQGLVRDMVSGFFILVEDQYRKGDVVRVGGVVGRVEDINFRRTVLRDLDGALHTIPHSQVAVATNFSRDFSGVNLDVMVAPGPDLDEVMGIINRVGEELAQDPAFASSILEPARVLRIVGFEEMAGFEDAATVFRVLGTAKPSRQWEVMGELRERIKKALSEQGARVRIPRSPTEFR